MTQSTTRELEEQLTAHLDGVVPPPGDLEAVLRRSRGRRLARLAGPGLLAAAAVGVTAMVLVQSTGPSPSSPDGDSTGVEVAAVRPLAQGSGLRAVASPGQRIFMAGRVFPYSIEGLDTDAVATPYGIAYYDAQGTPSLLATDGIRTPLSPSGSSPSGRFRPTIRADAARPHLAFATMEGDDVTVTVYDLEKSTVVATTGITCAGGCDDIVVDGIDSGLVFIRAMSGTVVWNYDRDETYRLAGRDTRVVDVRNQVLLYHGAAPSVPVPGWRYVPGAVDARLTFDGEHVLDWSSTLQPTSQDGAPVVLDQGPKGPDGLAWWAVDTDGSVLVAVAQPDPDLSTDEQTAYTGDNIVYDCEVPSGRCVELGPLRTTSGDPQFVGTDM